jgi:hypothetical protein
MESMMKKPTLIAVALLLLMPLAVVRAEVPNDVRLQPPKDLNGYFPFTPPKTKAQWDKRAEFVRRQILVAEGLWPMPTKTPLNAVIHGKIDLPEYTIEKVYFESVPGLFVTGNLYRPKNVKGKVPGVMFAHGHWKDARLSEETEAKRMQEIATGEERFEKGGHSRFQSMCVQLARMGCVVWQWDMLSDSDAIQFSPAVVHRFAKQRPEMNTLENWGLFSPQAEAHLQCIMGLQTLNSVRSLDFLLSLPEVDPKRVAITGASGGGTVATETDVDLSRKDLGIKVFPAQLCNIIVGDWHYFLCYYEPKKKIGPPHCIGRVHLETGKVQYLQVPTAVVRGHGGPEHFRYTESETSCTINSRGIDIASDKRSQGDGWWWGYLGSPTAIGKYVFFTTMLGVTYVINSEAEIFDERALVSVNDLGEPMQTWSLNSLSYAGGRIYHRSMCEIFCMGSKSQ